MKKISIVTLASFFFLLICSFVAVLLRGVIDNQIAAFVIGLVILAISGVFAFFGKDRTVVNVVCFFISAVAMGVLLRGWYINRGFNNSIGLMALISLAAVAYLGVFFALSRIPFIRKNRAVYIVYVIIYAILSAVGYLVVMTNTDTTYVSTFGYYMIIELAFIFAMSLQVNDRYELIRNLTLSTYSIFVVAIIAAVCVAIAAGGGDCDCDCGDGDCCECCDCSGCGGEGGSTKKKNDGAEKIKIDPNGDIN